MLGCIDITRVYYSPRLVFKYRYGILIEVSEGQSWQKAQNILHMSYSKVLHLRVESLARAAIINRKTQITHI